MREREREGGRKSSIRQNCHFNGSPAPVCLSLAEIDERAAGEREKVNFEEHFKKVIYHGDTRLKSITNSPGFGELCQSIRMALAWK